MIFDGGCGVVALRYRVKGSWNPSLLLASKSMRQVRTDMDAGQGNPASRRRD